MRLTGLAVLIVVAGGCATKSDVDRLSGEIAALRSNQDSLVALLSTMEFTLRSELAAEQSLELASRADLQRQLNDMERQLVQIQELLGQSQIVLQQLHGQTATRPLAAAEGDSTAPGGDGAAAAAAAGAAVPPSVAQGRADEPAVLYGAAIEQFRRGAYETARVGFEEFLVSYPADELAPHAQFYLAEISQEEGNIEGALRDFNRVVELYPNSRTAPTALYKAGLIQMQQGNKDFACEYFNRVRAGYPRSDEARLASDQADRLSC